MINTNIHTVFLLVGPTECGKSTFATEILKQQLYFEEEKKGFKANIQYISSDAIRQELLGQPLDKYEQRMLESSGQAFDMLYKKIEWVTSFPINAEFVIVDTTGLSDDFRAKVKEIAKANHYNVEVVLFDYKNREDYFTTERSHRLVANHVTRLRKDVIPVLAREKYDNIHKIKEKNFFEKDAYTVNISNKKEYLATILDQNQDYIIIGDVHECVETFKLLLLEFGFELEGNLIKNNGMTDKKKILLVGDFIDKGNQTKDMIEFLHLNQTFIIWTLGNHESFVYRYLKDEIKGAKETVVNDYFTSIPVIKNDELLHQKFNELVLLAQPFYRYIGRGEERKSFYVTHAPCKNEYIGKLDAHARREQRYFKLERELPIEPQLTFIRQDAASNHPYHFFGHVAAKHTVRIKNKILLDTGSASGNALTGVDVSFKLFFKSIPSKTSQLEETLPVLFKGEKKIDLSLLTSEQNRRLAYCLRNKINFISGTMAPADKDLATGELESLAKGLDYFKSGGVSHVSLQRKYMGSRCQIYLSRNIQDCRAVSRNGYTFGDLDLTAVYEILLSRFDAYMAREGLLMMLLDGELLPWSAAGGGLIEQLFKPVEVGLATEIEFLKANGFDDAMDTLIADYEATDFGANQTTMSKKALIKTYGTMKYQNFKYVKDIKKGRMPLNVHQDALDVYKKQLSLYGKTGELVYKPFNILKLIEETGEERAFGGTSGEVYGFINDDEQLLLDLSDVDAYEQALAFYDKLTTDEGMEGLVIKPAHESSNVVPYMKVRNKDYLTLVYGYDYLFPAKYAKLLSQKRIGRKLQMSLTEWRIGSDMLAVKLAEIDEQNVGYQETVAKILFEVEKEKELDPRL